MNAHVRDNLRFLKGTDGAIDLDANLILDTDDVLFRMGIDADVVVAHRSTALLADTALTNVLIGTPVSEALAANSFIGSNITASGDIAFYVNRGGNSEQFLFMDSSAGVLYLMANFGGIMLGLAADPPAPDNAMVHIWNATAGVVTAPTDALLVIENNAALSLTFLRPAGNSGGIKVASPTAANFGALLYDDLVADEWSIWVANGRRIQIGTSTVAFQQATTISTTTGNITISAASGVLIRGADNVATAVLLGDAGADYITIDTRETTSGVQSVNIAGHQPTIASASGSQWTQLLFNSRTVTFTGLTEVNGPIAQVIIDPMTVAGDTATLSVLRVTALQIQPPTEGTNVTLANADGIRILNATGTPTTLNGLVVAALTAGSTNNLQIVMTTGGTEPAGAVVDLVALYAVDIAAGRATLGIRSEETVIATAELASTHKLVVRINGVSYGILLTTTLT